MSMDNLKKAIFTEGDAGPDQVLSPVVKVRVRANWIPVHPEWARVRADVLIAGTWMDLTPDSSPLTVARVFSEGREAPELMVISVLKHLLEVPGVSVYFSGAERKGSPGFYEWSYWAELSARLGVAFQHTSEDSVALVGLS